MSRYEIVTINYDRILDERETKLSWCFLIGEHLIWLPKSQVEDIRETAKEIDAPRWLIEAKGLERFCA